MKFAARREMYAGNFVDYISQQVAVYHAVDCSPKNVGYHITPISTFAPC